MTHDTLFSLFTDIANALREVEGTTAPIQADAFPTRIRALQPGPVTSYEYIDPVDPDAFPVLNGAKVLTVDGSETWSASGGAMYTSGYKSIIQSQARAAVYGFCADYTFQPTVNDIASMDSECFIFNGTSSVPVNGNLSFKGEHTATKDEWLAWLDEHPVTILISTNDPDTSVWKPAISEQGVTGYWNGGDGFVAVKGGIPYCGENIITDEVIDSAYDNAWISSQYVWTTASGSSSFAVPVTNGAYYKLAWDTTDSDTVGSVFRYGFTDDNTPSSSNTLSAPRARTTPQNAQTVDVKAAKGYMVIQVANASFPDNVGHLSVREMIGYDPPVLLMAPRPEEPEEPEPEEEPEEPETEFEE